MGITLESLVIAPAIGDREFTLERKAELRFTNEKAIRVNAKNFDIFFL